MNKSLKYKKNHKQITLLSIANALFPLVAQTDSAFMTTIFKCSLYFFIPALLKTIVGGKTTSA